LTAPQVGKIAGPCKSCRLVVPANATRLAAVRGLSRPRLLDL